MFPVGTLEQVCPTGVLHHLWGVVLFIPKLWFASLVRSPAETLSSALALQPSWSCHPDSAGAAAPALKNREKRGYSTKRKGSS